MCQWLHKIKFSFDNFYLTRNLAQKLVAPAFEKVDLSRKLVSFFRTHEQIKSVKEKFFKENVVVCTRPKINQSIKVIYFSIMAFQK